MKIVIDAGHGGDDPGAIGFGGILEKDYTLNQALVAEEILTEFGDEVTLTRSVDQAVGNSHRAKIANDIGADIFVSYHFNASVHGYPSGTQILCHRSSQKGKTLANFFLIEIAPLDNEPDERWERVIPLPMDNFRGGTFVPTVIQKTRMPAIIVETEFGTNETDAALFSNPEYIKKVAEASCRAIQKWSANV